MQSHSQFHDFSCLSQGLIGMLNHEQAEEANMVESVLRGRATRRWVFGLALAAILSALILVLVAPRESPSTKGTGVPSAESLTPRTLPSVSPMPTPKPTSSAPLSK